MSKPPYRVPLMAEVAAAPRNGLNVVSTFSGCGGSCLGYRMAGFRVLWANEFAPHAQASYRANAAPGSLLDPRDVRQVRPEEILSAAGLKAGELDLLDGSPPCQAFSTAGKRAACWGKERRYDHGASQCNETLFAEYVRLLRGLLPRAFVAENVAGLVRGVAKGFFLEILRDLKASGYRVEARLLDAQWLGVPQMRKRVIFVGVREDLGRPPAFPNPLPYRYSVREALPSVGRLIHDTSGFVRDKDVTAGPCPTITNGVNGLNAYHYQVEEPAPAVPAGNLRVSHDESGRWSEGDVSERPCPTVRSGRAGVLFVEGTDGPPSQDGNSFRMKNYTSNRWTDSDEPSPAVLGSGTYYVAGRRKFTIAELKRVCAFPDDFLLAGSYAQQWACLGNSVPPVMMRHVAEVIRDRVFDRPACDVAELG